MNKERFAGEVARWWFADGICAAPDGTSFFARCDADRIHFVIESREKRFSVQVAAAEVSRDYNPGPLLYATTRRLADAIMRLQ